MSQWKSSSSTATRWNKTVLLSSRSMLRSQRMKRSRSRTVILQARKRTSRMSIGCLRHRRRSSRRNKMLSARLSQIRSMTRLSVSHSMRTPWTHPSGSSSPSSTTVIQRFVSGLSNYPRASLSRTKVILCLISALVTSWTVSPTSSLSQASRPSNSVSAWLSTSSLSTKSTSKVARPPGTSALKSSSCTSTWKCVLRRR